MYLTPGMSEIRRRVLPLPTLPTTASSAGFLKFRHERLGADPVIAQEHHGFLAVRVGDVHHFLGQTATSRRWNAWKSLYSLLGTRYWLL